MMSANEYSRVVEESLCSWILEGFTLRRGDEDARFDCIDVLQSLGSVAVPRT